MKKDILKDIIESFDIEKLEIFFRNKNSNFSFPKEKILLYEKNFENFTDGLKLAECTLPDADFVVCTFKVLKNLSQRSGKKLQYEIGKKILKSTHKDAGIFIFYDSNGNFRFSLIYTNYLGKRRDWSNFKRFTYFVSKDLTNKTFLRRIGEEADFSTLEKIKEAFSVEPVTKQFYTEIQNWFFWAMDKVEFPDDEDKDREIRNAKNLIRLITRLIFIWFMKVKKLIPDTLFDKKFIDQILNYKDKTGSTYYKAILQNLFFATLNTKMKKDDPKSRIFIEEAEKRGFINEGYLQQGYYRYSRFIKDKDLFLKQFENIPFLNGGLFDCLDKKVNGKEIRIDCFSDHPKNETRLKVPDELFFLDKEIEVDLTKHLSENPKKKIIRKVRGILEILKSYNFTIDENTPVDEEVALDPELLGKVFENLLAAYNPETKTTARKATGSYYTPKEIVEFMVNESLVEYFKNALIKEGITDRNLEQKLRTLLSYSDEIPEFSQEEKQKIVSLINNIKIIDPACGSGAFPMGVLHKLVLVLNKIDPNNELWLQHILEKVPPELREETEESLKNKPLDYIRKLGLIEHCIYGVDIQEIAIQISKLRFFISLLVEQEPDDTKPNRDIKALPNLETKFVAANTLIRLDKLPDELINDELKQTINQLFKIRENHFYANSLTKKYKLQQQEETLKQKLQSLIEKNYNEFIKIKKEKLTTEINQLKNKLEEIKKNPAIFTDTYETNLFGEKDTSQPQNITEKQIQKIKEEIIQKEAQLLELDTKILKNKILDIATKIIEFNPYNQNKSTGWFDPEWMFGIKDGFDIVIANPPYIQLQNSISINSPLKYADLYKDQNYFTFDREGDMYCLFYEKGIQLLKNHGILTYISSNKWMRSRYGEKLREFFTKHNPKVLIDLGPGIFESATVDTNIIIIEKTPTPPKNFHLKAVTLERNQKDIDIKNQLDTRGVILTTLNKDVWSICSSAEQQLKEKIERIGKPLKEWDVKIYRGVLTGLNDAFIITTEKRNEILKNCKTKEERKRTEAIIKPILRGRDIKRYYYEWANRWVIFIPWHFPLHEDSSIQGASEKAEREFKKYYPAIYNHLLEFKEQLSKRNKDETGIRYEWYVLQRCAATYYHEFEKEKVVWNRITDRVDYAFVDKNLYLLDSTFFFTGHNLKYLTALLNSTVMYFYMKFSIATLGNGMYGAKIYVERLPVPPITPENKPIVKQIENLVDEIIQAKKQNKNANTIPLEQKIDKLVYKLYNLTDEEIKIIEGY